MPALPRVPTVQLWHSEVPTLARVILPDAAQRMDHGHVLVYENRDLTRLPLIERRQILTSALNFQSPRIRIAEYFETSVDNMLTAVRAQGLEGVVAKKKDSQYEAGKRSGSWVKYRQNSGQELVVGGYVPEAQGLDSVIVGYYRGQELIYIASVREAVPARGFELSVCESSRNAQGALGRRLDYRGYGEVHLGSA